MSLSPGVSAVFPGKLSLVEGGIKPALPPGDGAFLPAGTVASHLSLEPCFIEGGRLGRLNRGPLVWPRLSPAVWAPVSRDQASSPPLPCLGVAFSPPVPPGRCSSWTPDLA